MKIIKRAILSKMPSEAIKEKIELEVFQKFTEACPLQIDLSSIQKCPPPQPDILCESRLIGKTFFELVELTNHRFNFHLHSRLEFQKLLEQAANQKPEFIKRYENACIWVLFKPNTQSSKRYIEKILDLLLADFLPPDFEGDVLFPAFSSKEGKTLLEGWEGKIESLEVHRENSWNHQTPCFWKTKMEPDDVGRVLERVKEKFEKIYNLNSINRAELLGYFNFHPPLPLINWKKDIHLFVKRHLSHSPFKRIWIFNIKKNNILYRYPE